MANTDYRINEVERQGVNICTAVTALRNDFAHLHDIMGQTLNAIVRQHKTDDKILNQLEHNGEALRIIKNELDPTMQKFNPICAHCGQEIPQ